MRFLILAVTVLSLFACRNYPLAKKSHFIDGVDEYFNLGQQRNVWLYMSYRAYNGETGVRTDELYPQDRGIFDMIGLRGRAMQVLFTYKSQQRTNYHLAVLQHRRRTFDYSRYTKFQGKNAYYYYYKDFEHDFLVVRHVVIPDADHRLVSMVYYVDKDKHAADQFKMLDYLAIINAQELQQKEGFRNFWQIFDCDQSQRLSVNLKIRQYLTKKEKMVYLKMFTLYEHQQGISFAKILTRRNADSLSLSLCPNTYAIEYRNQHDDLLATDTLYIAAKAER